MTKKIICIILAIVISICALFSIGVLVTIYRASGSIPSGFMLICILPVLCAFVIWRGIIQMK